MRANSGLKASEYGSPVLGLIFLRFADAKFTAASEAIGAKASARRKIGPSDYHAQRVIYLTDEARFEHLLNLPEGTDLGKAVNAAMRAVEEHNPDLAGGTERADKVLFIDAGSIFRQIDRAHRDFTDEQIECLANIVRVYRGENPEFVTDTNELFTRRFPGSAYVDVNGLWRVASIAEIAEQGFSLNPGRYVGTEVEDLDDEVFEEKLAAAHIELRELAARAGELEAGVDRVLAQLLER